MSSRILRQENYLIALFNKDLLDLHVRLPIPHSLERFVPPRLLAPAPSTELPITGPNSVRGAKGNRERTFMVFGHNHLTKALEWNLRFCLLGFLFDQRGQVRREFVKEKRRGDLVEG